MVRERLQLRPLTGVRGMMRDLFPRPDRTIRVPVASATGRVTVTPIHSPLTVPIADIAARDGFAVVSSETRGAS